ncbi:hypothetical protein [Streptomyces noursei]|nr:hypothetical protein [Streptomyces noursei]
MAEDNGGFVTTEKTNEGTTTVIVTTEGATNHPCPGGIVDDELLD